MRTVGGKRNWLAARAKGTVLVAFDDDDVYRPEYIARMCGALQHARARHHQRNSTRRRNATACTRLAL